MSSPLESMNQPTTFGSYELIEKVATGGMAEVFRARARRAAGVSKIVCLKRIHPNLCADPSFVEMFIEEARLGLTLSHGNIVPVFDFGCIDGYHFLVMEFVEGHDLADSCARARIVDKPFPIDLALHVVQEVLEGLSYAHTRRDEEHRPLNLVHRDISPSNVMVSSVGEVKILDFGIARSALREFRTRTGVIKGKPGYMAPEQARGDVIDHRVDIYACGVMLEELLTGRRPTADGADVDRLESSAVDEGDLIELDPELRKIVDRALARDPEARFGSAEEMAEELGAYLAARGLRPKSSRLMAFVSSLFTAPATSPDWTHNQGAVDRHLAALVSGSPEEPGPATERLEAGPTTERLEAGPTTEQLEVRPATEQLEVRPATEQLPPQELASGRRRKRVGLLLGAVALFLVVVGGLALRDRPDAVSSAPLRGPAQLAAAPEDSSRPAHVEIRSHPVGAEVVVDGVPRSRTTPALVALEPGTHRIELRLQGYEATARTLSMEEGQRVLLDLTLAPAPGRLLITSVPAGAAITVDGRERGTTPAEVWDLERHRSHQLELTKLGWETWRHELRFVDEQVTIALDAVLQRSGREGPGLEAPGFLSVVAHPWAEVVVDGQVLGVTPIIRHSLRSGRHSLVLRNDPRGAVVRRSILVTPGQEARISVDLTRPNQQ